MEKLLKLNVLLLLGLSLCFTSCLEDECEETTRFQEFVPLFVQPDDFRTAPQTLEAREMVNTGKIYFYKDIIMINEENEGIHLIDNSDPVAPNNFAFMEIKGNVDVSIKDDILYADSYVDFLAIDISDLQNPVLLCRDEEVFPNQSFDPQRGFLVDWIPQERVMEVDCNDPNFGKDFIDQGDVIFWNADVLGTGGGFPEASTSSTGQGGSFARFALLNDYIYVIDNFSLTPFDLSNPQKPERRDAIDIAWNIETLFAYDDHMFIGSQTGVFIYDVSNPEDPTYVSQFDHANACDPVIVKDDIAYITLRDETWCQNFTNQLDVVDVSDIRNPTLISTHNMDNPHGLGITSNALYICDGEAGLKSFDYEDLNSISDNQLDHMEGFDAFDVITLSDDHILVIGADGLYQFDTSDPKDINEISFLAVTR